MTPQDIVVSLRCGSPKRSQRGINVHTLVERTFREAPGGSLKTIGMVWVGEGRASFADPFLQRIRLAPVPRSKALDRRTSATAARQPHRYGFALSRGTP